MTEPIKTVAVTGLHRGENPQPGAAVIASLRRRFPKLRIVGLSYDPMESSLFGQGPDHPDAAYLIPFPAAGGKVLLERLDAICKTEAIGYVIPCLDSEIENYTKLLPQLRKRGIACVMPTPQSFANSSKAGLYAFCQRIGVPTPITLMANDPLAVEQHAAAIGYPVYVKGRLYNAHLAKSPAELAPAYDDIVKVWGWPIMVQQVIAGEEYDVTGVGDGKGNIIKSCSIRKLLRTSHGKGFGGIVVEDHDMDLLAKKIIKALRWNGPFELEFLKAPGSPHALMEINPRFPAWIDFPSQIGCNLPALLLERLLGIESQPLRTCTAGQMFIRHSVDLAGDFANFADMSTSGVQSITSLAIPSKSKT